MTDDTVDPRRALSAVDRKSLVAKERRVHRISKADPVARQLIPLDMILVTPVFDGVWTERIDVSWRSRELVIVSRAGLAHMKRIAGRPQDLVDLAELEGSDDQDE